jgi:uncharacterized protein YjiS (DUF1127 family)
MAALLMTRSDHAPPHTGEAGWAHWANVVMLMLRTYQTRRALLDMTPRELSDIGISRATAIEEASRLPWDIAPIGGRDSSNINLTGITKRS